MRKSLALILLPVLFSCATAQPQVQDPIPERSTGCNTEVNFSRRIDCISKMVKRLEDIENAVRTTKVKSEDRFDDYWVVITYEDCFADFCRTRKHIEYKPTFMARLREDGLKIGSGALIGAAIVLAL